MVELGPNLIRTYVPVLVGAIASWLTARGIHVNAATETQIVVALTSVFTAAYYTVARVLEEQFPAIGAVLLGSRPAQQLEPGDLYPEQPEVEQWPPPAERPPFGMDRRAAVAPQSYPAAPAPPQPQQVGQPPVHQQGSLAEMVAQTPLPPPRRRGPSTGAIPTYRRPAGR